MTQREIPDPGTPPEANARRPQLSRRALLGAAIAGSAGLVAGRVSGSLFPPVPHEASPADVAASSGTAPPVAAPAAAVAYPFFGAHQGGVSTPLQGHLHFAAHHQCRAD